MRRYAGVSKVTISRLKRRLRAGQPVKHSAVAERAGLFRPQSLRIGKRSQKLRWRELAHHTRPPKMPVPKDGPQLMSNIASALKEEISRIARKEIRRETSSLKKSSTAHRAEIAALKRRVVELERQLRRLGRAGQAAAPTAANDDPVTPGTRFSAKSMASQRRRLGLSAAECGLLIGASAQSVYNWEEGKARPRAQHLPAIFALRNLGRRQATEILEARKAA